MLATASRRRGLSRKFGEGAELCTRGACAPQSARDRLLQQFIKLFRAVDVHDALTQFLALLFSDHVAAERREFHRDFLFGHGIARIAFRDIDARRILFSIIRRDRYSTRLKFWKERFELVVGDDFHFVHDWNQRFDRARVPL